MINNQQSKKIMFFQGFGDGGTVGVGTVGVGYVRVRLSFRGLLDRAGSALRVKSSVLQLYP